jgi:hypothetical protein
MYLSNTNILQSRPVLGGGAVRGNTSTNATINWSFTESGADGNLIISGGASINATTSSAGTFTAVPGTIISSSLVGINWPTGSSVTSMSLFVNGAYTFAATSSVSSSKVMVAFTASANQNYTIAGYVNSYTPSQPGTGTYAYGFLKGGTGGSTFVYVDNTNTSQSVSLGEYLTSSVDNPFIFNTTIGINVTAGGVAAQVWSSPWTSSFTTGSSSNCKTTTFSNPNPSSPASNNFWLAAYIPCNSTTYKFRIVPPAQSYQDCVSYLDNCYFSAGGVYNTGSTDFTTGSAC